MWLVQKHKSLKKKNPPGIFVYLCNYLLLSIILPGFYP